MNKSNLVIIVLGIIILLAGFFLISYYFNNLKNECLSNPLVYGAKQITQQYNYEFFGYGYLHVPLGYKSPTFSFDSKNLSVEN